jgi:DNA-binding response OmpR family regulator
VRSFAEERLAGLHVTVRHLALVVEDHPPSAEDLADILRSIDCDSVIVDNKQAAIERIGSISFCFVLLDLEIKSDASSIKGHPEHGNSLLRELRAIFPDLRGFASERMPVLVVSAHAHDVDFAVNIMKEGADDVIRKPFQSSDVSARIRTALERSGRLKHDACAARSAARQRISSQLVLAIPGERTRRRTAISIGGRRVMLPDSVLKVLLHLVIAKLDGQRVHKVDLGGSAERGFKGISNLKQALQGSLPEGVDVTENDYQGNYQLSDRIAVGECNFANLRELDDAEITRLSDEVERRLRPSDPKV